MLSKRQDEEKFGSYEFTITIVGYGSNPDDAWVNACEAFEMDWGDTPERYKFIPEDT